MKKKYVISLSVAIVALIAVIVVCFLSRPVDLVKIIPANSLAVAQIDFKQMALKEGESNAIAKLLDIENIKESGLDFQSPAYIFESADGVFGLAIGIEDDDATEQWIEKLVSKGTCTEIAERNGIKFTTFANTALTGFNDNAMIIVGPVVAANEAEYQRKIAKYFKVDSDEDFTTKDIYKKLVSMDEGMVKLVAQTTALPERAVAPFALGAPSSSSPSDIYLAATINVVDGKYLSVEGESFAFNSEIDQSLKKATETYKKVNGNYLPTISTDDAFAISCNIAGSDYVKLLRSNPLFRTMLMGLNTTLDINKMLDGVDGDILIKGTIDAKGNVSPTLLADANNTDWISDVDYWKRSCPNGTTITNGSSPKTFKFASSDYHVDFGMTNGDKTLFFMPSGGSQDILAPANNALPKEIVDKMKASKLCALVNIKAMLAAYGGSMATKMAEPILGNINTIVIGVK